MKELIERGAKALREHCAEVEVMSDGHFSPDIMYAAEKLVEMAITAALGDDYAIVPRAPTEAMLDAALDFHGNGKWDASDESCFGGHYKAMVAAASPPRSPAETETPL